jgi:hypothetical protein
MHSVHGSKGIMYYFMFMLLLLIMCSRIYRDNTQCGQRNYLGGWHMYLPPPLNDLVYQTRTFFVVWCFLFSYKMDHIFLILQHKRGVGATQFNPIIQSVFSVRHIRNHAHWDAAVFLHHCAQGWSRQKA